jgi:hypothetical protein
MNTSRIEVPLVLAPPRFEDESTLATARQVKPIGRAKVTFRVRQAGAIMPLLLAATLCGALGASAVNYYERRREAQKTVPETPVTTTIRPAGLAVSAAATDLTGRKTVENQISAAPAKNSDNENDEAAKPAQTKAETGSSTARRDDESREPIAPKTARNNNADPAKLTRQRRVRPTDEPVNKNGAGRIGDLFSGPNP